MKKFKNFNLRIKTQNPIQNQKGQGLVEYLVLVALISVATIGVIKVVGKNLAKQYENINRAMGAKTSEKLEIENASSANLKQKDLSNFIDGSRVEAAK